MKARNIRMTLASIALIPALFTGCASTGGLAAGSDAAHLNGTRGRGDAQISEAQAKQYDRQRQEVLSEQQLEQQKQNAQAQSFNNGLQEVQSTLGTVRNIAGMFGGRF